MLAGFACAMACAAGGTGAYTLPWRGKGEILRYHSCGCADACWVAEVRVAKTGAVKARLRCDCEKLYAVYPWPGKERLYAESCGVVGDGADKPRAISQELEKLLQRIKPDAPR